MQKLISNSLRSTPAALVLLFCLLANHAGAVVTTWDPQGSNTQNPYLGSLSGTWENNNWSTSQTGQATPGAWVENTAAQFAVHSGTGTPAFTVTMNANHTVAGMFSGPLTPNPCIFTIQGTGTMLLPAGLQGFDINSNTGNPGEAIINVLIADATPASPCEIVAEGSGQIFLNNAGNSYKGGTLWGYSGTFFSGIININAGAWSLPGNSPFGSGGICFSNTSTSIAALVVNGAAATVIPNNVTNAASALPKIHIVAPSGGLTFTGEWDVNGNAQIGPSGGTVTFSGLVKGAGGVGTCLGIGSPTTLVLSGVNTYTGGTTNWLGTLSVNTIGDSTPSAIGTSSTANLAFSGGTFQYTGAGAATTARPVWLTAASTLDLPNGNLTLNGAFKSSSAANKLTKTSAGTLTLGGAVDNSSLALAVNGGTVILNKTSGSSVHGIGGATSVGSGGTLQLSGTGGFEIFSGVALTVASGGVFDANGQSDTFTSLSLSGTGISSGGALINNNGSTTSTLTTATTLAANSSIGGSANITLASAVAGATGITLTKIGSGILTLNGVNTYVGNTTISAGTLTIGGAGTLGSGSYAGVIANSGTLTYNSSAAQTLSGGISGAGGLNVTGAGTLTLSGSAAYNAGGATTVSAGKLLVNAGSSLGNGSGTVTVNGGTLGGTGTINDPTTVNSGGTLSTVDGSIANLTFGSSLGLSGTTRMEISAGTLTADEIVMTSGTVTLGGNLNVANIAGTPTIGNTFQLISGTMAGGFSSYTLPALAAGLKWDTSQLAPGGAGTITVVCSGTLAASAGPNQDICSGSMVVIGGSPTASGSTAPYTYSWSPNTGLSDPTLANPTATPTSTTTYTVTVTDSFGCTTATSSMTVGVDVAPTISTQPANTTVCSGSTATFSVTAVGSGLAYSWANDSNGGWGNAWNVTGSGSTWLGSSTVNDNFQPDCNTFSAAGDINSPIGGNALGMYGGSGGDEVATRTFSALAVGQVVSIDFDSGNVDSSPVAKVGFSLQTSAPVDVLQFYFVGGQANYKRWDDVSNEQDTGIVWGYTGTRVQFVLTSATTYSLIVTPCGGSPTTITGTFSGATIAQVKLFNGNTAGGDQDNVYFNNFLIGGYSDNADNYTSGWAGVDKGNQPILVGNGASTYTTPALSVADSGSQYQVVVSGCAGSVISSAATATVNARPTAVASGSTPICIGGSTTISAALTGTGPWNVTWSDGAQQNGVASSPATRSVSPSTTTTYTVTALTDANCTAQAGDLTGSAVVTVNPLPTVSVNSTAICPGGSATLTATTSASSPSYLWNDPDSSTTASITVSPASTTTYTVTVTDGTTSCANNGSGTVTVNPLPTVSVNSATICAGGLATLTATTSASSPSYLWNDPGSSTTASITVSPASTTTYTVTVTDGVTGCINSGSGTVTVNPLPTVSVNSATICAGGSATLTATTSAGTPSYLWSPGGQTTASITVSPASTTTYTVTVTDGVTLCANSGSGTVTVNPLPTVSVNSTTICAGGSATLTATTGAGTPSYLWSPGAETTASITVSPASTTTYTVTVTDGGTGCANSGSGTVTVNPQPVLTIDTTNQTACAGSEVMWSVAATGTSLTYQWQRDGTNLLEGVDNFTGTMTAILTNSAVAAQDGVDAAHGYACIISSSPCSDITSTLVSLTVTPLPTVSVNSETICAGGSATLTATTSASSPSYLWNDPGSSTTASITVSPASTTTYTVTVTDGTTSCAISGSGTVTVNPLPTVSVNSETICAGASATLTATTSASSPSYLWSPGGATTASITVSPASTTTYTVTVTDGTTSCANSGSGTVTVNPLPTVSVDSATICGGGSATLTATTSASSPNYLWSPGGATTASITVSPASTTTYTVTVTVTDGTTTCANSGSGTVTVNPLPTVSVNSAAICGGGSATLTATTSASSPSYLWSPGGATTASITVSPVSTTTYTVTVTDGTTSCANSGSGTVTVNPAPTADAGADQTICSGSPVGIGGSPTAGGGTGPYTYSWVPVTGLDDATVANPTATVMSTTTYTVTVTDASGCTASDSVVVTVIPQPEITSITMSGTDVMLVWSSLAGQTYRVQYTTDLPDPPAPASWTDLTPDVPATGATATYTDHAGAATQRFYRIKVVCP